MQANKVPQPVETPIFDDLQTLKNAAFAFECVAHLQGQEKVMLPIADKLRALIERLETDPN